MLLAAAMVLVLSLPAAAEPDLKKGARAYYYCYNCHSLHPGVHLTGPSLANLWRRPAGRVQGFGRYSDALRAADFVWSEETLDTWLRDPQALVPGNTMAVPGIAHAGVRENLIGFLQLAMGPRGAERVVERGLITETHAAGRVPDRLADAAPGRRVTAIRRCGDAYRVATADGRETVFWERNLHFKTDGSERGPRPGRPVLVQIGSVGDRASVVFADPAELAAALGKGC